MKSKPIIDNAASFREEARFQGLCANPECKTPRARFHAHHVVPKQWLRQRHLPLNDTRNALRLCTTCHMQFEWAGPGKVQILVEYLTQQNLCFIWEVMGNAGIDFLQHEYNGGEDDHRWTAHLDGMCLACQL